MTLPEPRKCALAAALALAVAVPARADFPLQLAHSGYLLDAGDQPLNNDAVTLRFTLHDADTAGATVWDSGACVVSVKSGFYATALGASCGAGLLASQVPPGAPRWLQVWVGTTPLAPRLLVSTAPTAAFARVADAVSWSGGTVALDSNGRWAASTLDLPTGLVSTDTSGHIPEAVLPTTVPLLDSGGRLAESALPTTVPLLDVNGKLPSSELPGGAAGLDATSVGGHTPKDASAGDKRLALLDTAGKLDADTVGGYSIAVTPTANALLPLDGTGKFPASVCGTGAGSYSSISIGSYALDATAVSGLLTPTLLTPANAATTSPLPGFTWSGVGPFRVEVATAAAPTTVVWTVDTALPTTVVDVPLTGGTAYVWRVKSLAGGNAIPSEQRTFTTGGVLNLSGATTADTVRTTLTASTTPGATSLVVAANVFKPGDVLLVIALQGETAGRHEFAFVRSVSGSTITLTAPMKYGFSSADHVQVQRALSGAGITVAGTVSASAWNGELGGVVAMYSFGNITMQSSSSLNVDGLGYRGGAWRANCSGVDVLVPSGAGESYLGAAGNQNASNAGGAGGSDDGCAQCTSGGTGGSHATLGVNATSNTPGDGRCLPGHLGYRYGDGGRELATFGSGGGAGGNNSNGGPGGRGGGAIVLFATGTIDTSQGTLSARGQASNGQSYQGGGGAGGTIRVEAPTVVTGTTDVTGGAGGGFASAGGAGHVRVVTGTQPAAITLTGNVVADMVRTTLTSSVSVGATFLPLAKSVFRAADVLLVIDLQGANAGQFEFVTVNDVTATGANLTTSLTHAYSVSDRVVVQRAISAPGITVNGTVTATRWNGTTGSVVALYSTANLTLGSGATITADDVGFAGGAWRSSCSGVTTFTPAGAGESYSAPGSNQNAANGGGAGGSDDGCAQCTSGGSGGGYGTAGTVAASNTPGDARCAPGVAGGTYGDTSRNTVFLGSGGGAGGNNYNGGTGGRGGGAVILFATGTINAAAGSITARGGVSDNLAGGYGGGGGSGGTILAVAPSVTLGTTDVTGGASSGFGRAGGSGRVKSFNQAP